MSKNQKDLVETIKGRKPLPKTEDKEKEDPAKKEASEEIEKKEDVAKDNSSKSDEPDVKGAFEKQANRPSKEQIEEWKVKHGNVFASAFSDIEVIVWRPLTREEYRNLKMMIAQSREQITQEDHEEAVVEVCTLWPAPDTEAYSQVFMKAGVFSTLYEQITQASHFVPPGYAGVLVAEL